MCSSRLWAWGLRSPLGWGCPTRWSGCHSELCRSLHRGGRRSWTESKERKLKKLLQKVLSQEITQKSTLKSTKKRTLAGEYSEKYSKKYWKKCVKKHSRRTELKKVLQKVLEKILKKVLPSVSTLGRKVTLTEKCITNLEEAFIADKALEQIKRLSATTSLWVLCILVGEIQRYWPHKHIWIHESTCCCNCAQFGIYLFTCLRIFISERNVFWGIEGLSARCVIWFMKLINWKMNVHESKVGANWRVKGQCHFSVSKAPGALIRENTIIEIQFAFLPT